MKVLLLLVGLFVFDDGIACSPTYDEPVVFDPTTAYDGELTPPAPVARVANIDRGRPAGRDESSCVETSSITVAVRDDSQRLPFYFEFREVGGSAPDLIFQSGLYSGGSNGSGERLFTFYWPEISRSRKPVDLLVEITPFTRSGIRGPSVVIAVSDATK